MDSKPGNVICEICRRRHHPQKLPFFCATDARNALYEGRFANAKAMMEVEELEQRVSALLNVHDSSQAPVASNPSPAYVDKCASDEQKAKDRTEQIMAAADKLQQEVDAARRDIEERRAAIARRKTDLASASQGIAARRNRELEETKTSVRKLKYHWDREHEATAQYRAALCAEVAKLYRLQRVRRGTPVRFEYKIGGLEVVDLHHLNSMHPEHISASLGHIAHLLWLASHYLAVRLPAEITLPHNDYPRATIFSLSSSYHHGQVGFPGASPLPVDALDRQYGHVPHPRPLFLDKPLSSFSKDESNNYTAFLEGVCLLAYNIVWLCRTQGIPVGDNGSSFEDFTFMGRNLYNLLNGSSLQRNQPGQPLINANASSPNRAKTGSGDAENDDITKAAPKMGHWSHGTAHTSLNSAEGQDFTRSFKLPNPIKLADKLKARLAQDAPVPEWELIEDDDFAPNDLDDGVLVGGTPQSKVRNPRYGLESYMSVNTVRSNGSGDARASLAAVSGASAREKDKGSNGWTKIKPR
ncbi:putative UV radiation resistance protein and autophagy-related subunit 14-domain-containing protein [Seiridium unicorne]|uniref:Autophagy-related protein 14 n=1 Tax=Seiridium unicorne TaxID=138068 RepID=A0ABR2UK07_9PEZI